MQAMLPVAAAALGASVLALSVAHGILRPFLETRGVVPWTFRDTVGSTPLVWLGAGVAGAGTVMAALAIQRDGAVTILLAAMLMLIVGALSVRLGLLALRKLT